MFNPVASTLKFKMSPWYAVIFLLLEPACRSQNLVVDDHPAVGAAVKFISELFCASVRFYSNLIVV